MPQCFFVNMAFNGNPRDVTGILDQLQIGGIRGTRFAVKDGKCAQGVAFAREEGARPD